MINPMDINPDTGLPYEGYSSPSLDTTFHDIEMAVDEPLRKGDRVRCLSGSIDKNKGRGEIGRITGFARLSSHHPREAYVQFGDSGGWFWLGDLDAVAAA